jgi:hypothetical protein
MVNFGTKGDHQREQVVMRNSTLIFSLLINVRTHQHPSIPGKQVVPPYQCGYIPRSPVDA